MAGVIKQFPGVASNQIDKAKAQLEDIIRLADMLAQARRAVYEASIKEQFTPEQALELCKKL